MRPSRLTLVLALLIVAAVIAAVLLGESVFDGRQWAQAFADPASGPGEVLWQVRAPRVVTALMVGAALGLPQD
ncbi:MAG TPA: iron chelate uptake ABC transporter family permease subunit, partial [Brevundimonas sp.]|nr:iron chelate uptake ABC transporter family permease subunit [Brevundimonas sp.]